MDDQALASCAAQAAKNAYSPYSKFQVGAVALSKCGRTFTGCNVENASYGLTICAERVALSKAISEGFREFEAIAVSVKNGGSPCGACRQFIFEFGENIRIILADEVGKILSTTTSSELLPMGFRFNNSQI